MASDSYFGAGMKRKVLIVLVVVVVVFHMTALWTMRTGLLRREVQAIKPAEILLQFIVPPPKVEPAPLAAPSLPPIKPPLAKTKIESKAPVSRQTAAPPAVALVDPTPLPYAPVGVVAPAPTAAAPTDSAVAEAPTLPARVEPPSSAADYLQNAKPGYPALSQRLGEHGKVVLRVLIGVDGQAQKAEVKQSSGFDRLDQAALRTVLRWRYVPGKLAGVPQAMWFDVPISFVLE